jgi:hypothetical protein
MVRSPALVLALPMALLSLSCCFSRTSAWLVAPAHRAMRAAALHRPSAASTAGLTMMADAPKTEVRRREAAAGVWALSQSRVWGGFLSACRLGMHEPSSACHTASSEQKQPMVTLLRP